MFSCFININIDTYMYICEMDIHIRVGMVKYVKQYSML